MEEPMSATYSLIGQEVHAHIGIHEYNGEQRNHVAYYVDPLPEPLAILLLGNWLAWLKVRPCPRNADGEPRIHHWIFSAARTCRFHGLPPNWAHDLIRREVEPHRSPAKNEIENAIAKAYDSNVSNYYERVTVEFNEDKLDAVAARIPFEITNDWLAEISPECVLDATPSMFLDAIFRPDERVFVENSVEAKHGFIYRPGSADHAKRLNSWVRTNTEGIWFVSNPVNGEFENDSWKSYGNLTDYRHLILESDFKHKREEWIKMILQLPLAVVAMYESGNRSVHALINTGAKTLEEFHEFRRKHRHELVEFGACPGAMGRATQPTRLPGAVRCDNGREQRLLYLDPEADGTPILKRNADR
jgi:hypothetical protein